MRNSTACFRQPWLLPLTWVKLSRVVVASESFVGQGVVEASGVEPELCINGRRRTKDS